MADDKKKRKFKLGVPKLFKPSGRRPKSGAGRVGQLGISKKKKDQGY